MQLDINDTIDQTNDRATDERSNDQTCISEFYACITCNNGRKYNIGTNTHIKKIHTGMGTRSHIRSFLLLLRSYLLLRCMS